MIHEQLLDAERQGRDMANIPRLQVAERAKFNKKEIASIACENVLLGRLNVCEVLLLNHQSNPYQTVEELIGDLQVIMVKSNEALRLRNHHHTRKFGAEDLMNQPTELQ